MGEPAFLKPPSMLTSLPRCLPTRLVSCASSTSCKDTKKPRRLQARLRPRLRLRHRTRSLPPTRAAPLQPVATSKHASTPAARTAYSTRRLPLKSVPPGRLDRPTGAPARRRHHLIGSRSRIARQLQILSGPTNTMIGRVRTMSFCAKGARSGGKSAPGSWTMVGGLRSRGKGEGEDAMASAQVVLHFKQHFCFSPAGYPMQSHC